MNQMRLNEPFLGVRRSNLFCQGQSMLCPDRRGAKQIYAHRFQGFWFISVHSPHWKAYLEQVFDKLMNLMNLDELTYCLGLAFAMNKKAREADELGGGRPSASSFMKFITSAVMEMGRLVYPTLSFNFFYFLQSLNLCGLTYAEEEMDKALSKRMIAAIEHMSRNENKLVRFPGGYWARVGWHMWAGPCWGTPTVEAIVRRGYAEYTVWKDGRRGEFPIECTLTQQALDWLSARALEKSR